MVIDKVDDRDIPRFLIYDAIHFENEPVGQTKLEIRLLCIKVSGCWDSSGQDAAKMPSAHRPKPKLAHN